jgi:hypothetical protein
MRSTYLDRSDGRVGLAFLGVGSDHSGHAEICNLRLAVVSKQDVSCRQISVNNSFPSEMSHTTGNTDANSVENVAIPFSIVWIEENTSLHVGIEGSVAEKLHREREVALLLAEAINSNDILQYNVSK